MSARDVIANVLDVHQMQWIGHEEGWDCGCNARGELGPWLTLGEAQQHQADAAIAAIRSMPAEDQAELIGGEVVDGIRRDEQGRTSYWVLGPEVWR